MKKISLIIVLLLSLGARASAQANEIDLNFVFSQLKGNGLTPFANALYPGNPENAKVLVDHLNPLIHLSGDFTGFEILSRRYLTKRIERVEVAIYFESFPIYMRIDYYETARGRIFLPAKFSKEAAEILPFDLISASGK